MFRPLKLFGSGLPTEISIAACPTAVACCQTYTHIHSIYSSQMPCLASTPTASLPAHGFNERVTGRWISVFTISADDCYFSIGGIQPCNKEQAFPMFFKHMPCIRVLNGTKAEPVPHAGVVQVDNSQLANPH